MSLPPELYEEVLWHVALENRRDPFAIPFEFSSCPKNSTLNECMLVNQHFAEISRRHVFASISVNQFENEGSLRWAADILSGEFNKHTSRPPMVAAGHLVQSFVINISPQSLTHSKVALLTRIALIVQQSPRLITLGLLNTHPSFYNFATLPPYAGPMLETFLRLCLLPNLRHLSLSGLKSVPVHVTLNPNLESLNLQSVILQDPTPHGPSSSDDGPVTPTLSRWSSSLPILKTLSFSRFKGNWDRLLPPQITSDFVDFAEAILSRSPPLEHKPIVPLFPQLTTLIWTLSRAGSLYSADLTTTFINEHAPNLKSLKLYASHFYIGFPPVPNLRALCQLKTWELIVTYPPVDTHVTAIERIAGCIDWTTRAVAAAGPTLTSFTLHLDFYLNYTPNSSTEDPQRPWMTHSPSLLALWIQLSDEIARCPAKDVRIHVDVRYRAGERFAPPEDFQREFRSQTCRKLEEVFVGISRTKDSYEYIPHYSGTHYRRLRSTIPF